jgi:predicted NUDIX family NTP pyrophosphohydrolase
MFRYNQYLERYEYFIVFPGGPLHYGKDDGWWSIPKGRMEDNEVDILKTAIREFKEETGFNPVGHFLKLTPVKRKGNRTIHIFAFNATCDEKLLKSNTFEMEWPEKSGKIESFYEIEKGGWFSSKEAKIKLRPIQGSIIDELEEILLKG